jgi:low temperature requirement protein LtrA
LWWIYFDLVGHRLPRTATPLTNWVLSHLPIALSIVAAGAAIVSLIEHAHDARAPEATAWLLAGAVALGLLALIVIEQSLEDAERLILVYRPLAAALALEERSPRLSSAGYAQRRGSWRCFWTQFSPWSGHLQCCVS